ncbi:MAG TPA: response regulator transcription factor [Bacteroidales bacterium]|nr:response regulator transcription factor [Bacteroidales bacterium]
MIRVIIVDNDANFRKGLKTILLNIGEVEVTAEASNGEEFLELLSKVTADIVFMDVKMPLIDGIEATRKAKSIFPKLCIIGFSSYETEDYINKMLNAGANGYLSKSGDNYDLLTQIINNPQAGLIPAQKKLFNK